MVSRNKKKVSLLSCSTPEPPVDSPSHDSDATYDSDSASPVPFICTQDGTEGETDVVWNFYTPNSKSKNTTPLSRHRKKCVRPRLIEKSLPKRRAVKNFRKNNELYQELNDLQQNLHELINKKSTPYPEKLQSDEDMFSDTSDNSVKNSQKKSNHCLRKNILNSKYKIEPETGGLESESGGLESDDSINDCLIKVSQMVEDNIMPLSRKADVKNLVNTDTKLIKPTIDNDSMDAILSSKLDSPSLNKFIKYNSPKFNNDSFDNLLENLNESALERLSQMPVHQSAIRTPVSTKLDARRMRKESIVNNSSPTSSSPFNRYKSMPESPSINTTKPSTSGTAFQRYKSMPFNKSENQDDSPIKCTPDEIEKKHQQAREKLIAKRMLPFTTTQQTCQSSTQVKQNEDINNTKKKAFQPKVQTGKLNNIPTMKNISENHLKSIIEQKRQEAIMKLRKRHNKDSK